MDQRVPPSVRTSQMIRQLLSDGTADGDVTSQFIRLAIRKACEEALEAEAADTVGRGFYEHGHGDGYRNGYRPGKLKTAEGVVEYAAPQISDTRELFKSKGRQHLGDRSDELTRLATEMYAGGLSTRDIDPARLGLDRLSAPPGHREVPKNGDARVCITNSRASIHTCAHRLLIPKNDATLP